MSWSGKSRPDPLTSTRPDLLQYFYFVYIFLNTMSDISEHDESEFYYPDEVSDAVLLEQTTFIENTESHRNLLSDESIQNFIKGQQQMSTVKKTMYDMNVFQNFLSEVGEEREVLSLPPAELDKLLCNFYITVRKKDKTEYEPDTISSFSRSIQRYVLGRQKLQVKYPEIRGI